jgi:hypothetical protein
MVKRPHPKVATPGVPVPWRAQFQEEPFSRLRRHLAPKNRHAGRADLRLPAPTPQQVKEARLRVHISQSQACDLVHVREVMTWSKWENEKHADADGHSGISPATWDLFLMKTGQHPGFLLLPRMDVPLPFVEHVRHPRRTASAEDITFAVEENFAGNWARLGGRPFSTMAGACTALNAMQLLQQRQRQFRIARYVGDQFSGVVEQPSRGQAEAC